VKASCFGCCSNSFFHNNLFLYYLQKKSLSLLPVYQKEEVNRDRERERENYGYSAGERKIDEF
jgi:hypothetical protein